MWILRINLCQLVLKLQIDDFSLFMDLTEWRQKASSLKEWYQDTLRGFCLCQKHQNKSVYPFLWLLRLWVGLFLLLSYLYEESVLLKRGRSCLPFPTKFKLIQWLVFIWQKRWHEIEVIFPVWLWANVTAYQNRNVTAIKEYLNDTWQCSQAV